MKHPTMINALLFTANAISRAKVWKFVRAIQIYHRLAGAMKLDLFIFLPPFKLHFIWINIIMVRSTLLLILFNALQNSSMNYWWERSELLLKIMWARVKFLLSSEMRYIHLLRNSLKNIWDSTMIKKIEHLFLALFF